MDQRNWVGSTLKTRKVVGCGFGSGRIPRWEASEWLVGGGVVGKGGLDKVG